MKLNSKYLLLLIFLAVIATLLVISKTKKQPSPRQTPVSYQKEELEGKVVSDFPNIPIFPAAEIIKSYKKTESSKVGYEAGWTTTESIHVVVNWYIDNLKNNGWDITDAPENISEDLGESFISANKGLLNVAIILEEDGNEVSETKITIEFPLQESSAYKQ